jgi:LysM repeat protein
MMNSDTNTSKTKLCPVCGTKLNESATRCLVCGTELDKVAESKKSAEINPKRLPEVTLSLPAILGIGALFITLAAAIIFLILRPKEPATIAEITQPIEGTATSSPTITNTPTVTLTPTLAPTWTPLPPLEYSVRPGDSCAIIAARFGISVQSIILENNLSANCDLFEDMNLLIPQPTPTASPQPTATLSDIEKTDIACETINYEVVANDTLSSIADTYNVSMATIREYNSLLSDTVYETQTLRIPLCQREPTPGPTPTATPLPPYAAPNLLLPADGASFTSASDTITLQWAAVGELNPDEAYAVTIVDLTSDNDEILTEYVNATSFIVPSSFLAGDNKPHVYRWSVYIVRQTGGDEEDLDNWEIAGNKSLERVFSWFNLD